MSQPIILSKRQTIKVCADLQKGLLEMIDIGARTQDILQDLGTHLRSVEGFNRTIQLLCAYEHPTNGKVFSVGDIIKWIRKKYYEKDIPYSCMSSHRLGRFIGEHSQAVEYRCGIQVRRRPGNVNLYTSMR